VNDADSKHDEMAMMAVSVIADEFVSHGPKEKSKPRPFKSRRIGRPERQSRRKRANDQCLADDVLKWYYSALGKCQLEKKR